MKAPEIVCQVKKCGIITPMIYIAKARGLPLAFAITLIRNRCQICRSEPVKITAFPLIWQYYNVSINYLITGEEFQKR